MSATLVILLTGALVATNCALVGSFLVLRRLSLVGDAISHAVLPGIAIAFLLTESRSPLPMIVGASTVGVVTVFLVELVNKTGRVHEDASIGVVFPALFSIGVILISHYASQVHLDLDCVLYGEIGLAPWDLLEWGDGTIGPKSLWMGGAVLVLNLGLVTIFYKELKIASFDPELASSLGFSPVLVHYLLMAAVSITVVGSFESVGAILVVAMLVVPAATAYLLTHRLSVMLVLSVVIGLLSAVLGYGFSRWMDCSIAGGMASVCGVLFFLAFLLSPEHGLLARAFRHRKLRLRLAGQLVLLHLTEGGEVSSDSVRQRFGWNERKLGRILRSLLWQKFIEEKNGGLKLTPRGDLYRKEVGTSPLVHSPDS